MELKLNVKVIGVGLLFPEEGRVPNFKPRAHIPERKSIRLMTRAVQLGVSAAGLALKSCPDWESCAPEDRAFYIGASPQVGDEQDLKRALSVSMKGEEFEMRSYAEHGISQIHPLWLVKGLSNNILGYASAFWNFQGINMNYCQGEDGGWEALVQGARAVEEGRAAIALCGGADVLTGAENILGSPCSEGAAFIIWGPSSETLTLSKTDLEPWISGVGELGAAKWPVALARKLLAKE